MDLRIVNTCNNNCLYCLEQDLRQEDKYISYKEISEKMDTEVQREVLCFYGGNPLLHPKLGKIIRYGRSIGYKNISFLSNGQGLNLNVIEKYQKEGLTGISLYMHSLDPKIHTKISRSQQTLQELLNIFGIVCRGSLHVRCIIHTHALNISDIPGIIYFIHKKFGIQDFECISYLAVSRAYDFDNLLGYDISNYKGVIYKLKKIIEKNDLRIQFKGF